jgi:hypothetical protein
MLAKVAENETARRGIPWKSCQIESGGFSPNFEEEGCTSMISDLKAHKKTLQEARSTIERAVLQVIGTRFATNQKVQRIKRQIVFT